MRLSLICATLIAALSISAAASAQPATESASTTVPKGARIFAPDGSPIGRVEYIQNGSGAAGTAAVIYKGRMVHIPLDTVSANENRYVTKLTRSEVGKLK